MKWTTIILMLFGLTACNNRTDKSVVDEKAKTVHIDSFYIDSTEVGGDYKEYHNCNFDSFIADKKTPKLAKDIYIPYTDLIDFNKKPFVTSQIKSISDLNELKVYSRNFSGGIESVQINENHAQNEPVIFISVISDDKIEYAALPWSWCECTRDSQWIDGNGQTHTSTMGTCENRGDCSRCGRSDIRGNCRGGSCPGC